jgi:glucan biosynthesis protein
MQFRLPFAGFCIPIFKLRDTEVHLVVNKTLCSFTGLKVQPLKTLTEDILSMYGASYYRRGTLYCSNYRGGVLSYEIGSLSN